MYVGLLFLSLLDSVQFEDGHFLPTMVHFARLE